MFDPERLAGERVHDRDVGGAVVGHHPLDPDPVRTEAGDRARRLLVLEQLDVGEPGRVGAASPEAAGSSPAPTRPLPVRVAGILLAPARHHQCDDKHEEPQSPSGPKLFTISAAVSSPIQPTSQIMQRATITDQTAWPAGSGGTA